MQARLQAHQASRRRVEHLHAGLQAHQASGQPMPPYPTASTRLGNSTILGNSPDEDEGLIGELSIGPHGDLRPHGELRPHRPGWSMSQPSMQVLTTAHSPFPHR